MSLLVLDKSVERRLCAQRKAWGVDQHDEVWEGVYVMSPITDNEHQAIVKAFTLAFYDGIDQAGLGEVLPGANVSDRIDRWTRNYRTPDVVVILDEGAAKNHKNFWTGPIDFLVEIVSRGDRSRRKLPFYSKLGVRELLVVDRNPWRLTLYRHNGASLVPAATNEIGDTMAIESEVLPFSFQIVPAADRPRIRIAHKLDGRSWQA